MEMVRAASAPGKKLFKCSVPSAELKEHTNSIYDELERKSQQKATAESFPNFVFPISSHFLFLKQQTHRAYFWTVICLINGIFGFEIHQFPPHHLLPYLHEPGYAQDPSKIQDI